MKRLKIKIACNRIVKVEEWTQWLREHSFTAKTHNCIRTVKHDVCVCSHGYRKAKKETPPTFAPVSEEHVVHNQ